MSILSVGLKRGEEIGKEIGEATGTRNAIFGILEEYGPISDWVRQQVESENNLETLKEWFKKALRMRSPSEFEEYLRGMEEDQ